MLHQVLGSGCFTSPSRSRAPLPVKTGAI